MQLVFGDPYWLTKLHYRFQDGENLVKKIKFLFSKNKFFVLVFYYGLLFWW
jgi:hypothetical protein